MRRFLRNGYVHEPFHRHLHVHALCRLPRPDANAHILAGQYQKNARSHNETHANLLHTPDAFCTPDSTVPTHHPLSISSVDFIPRRHPNCLLRRSVPNPPYAVHARRMADWELIDGEDNLDDGEE